MGVLPEGRKPSDIEPSDETPAGQSPTGDLHEDTSPAPLIPAGQLPPGRLDPGITPYMDVEGRGKRPLRYCRTVQDGHTSSEQIAYQALWAYARRFGQAEPEGSYAVDIGLARICELLSSDHKNVKRLLRSLQEKLAIEVVQQPDCKLAIPTRYRVFSYSQIMERRRRAGLVWVIRTRATRFVDLAVVERLLNEAPLGQLPTGENY